MKKLVSRLDLRRGLIVCAASLVALVSACGDDDPAGPGEQLCAGNSGFGARVMGRAEPVDVCVSNDNTTMLLSVENNYSVRAAMTAGNVTFSFDLVFPHRDDAPVVLTLHDDLGAALADEFGAYVYYQETPTQGEAIESFQITAGSFTLAFSDRNVVTATMSDVTFKMQTLGATPEARGTRVVEKAFLSLSVDS